MATSTQSISALLQRSTIDDHEEVIKACNAVLKNSKHDLHALHVKTVALVKLDRFEDAIRVVEEGGDALKNRVPLEWSYCLYKIGKLEDAIKIAASAETGRGGKHVEAQATYRAEHFRRTADIYKELSAEDPALAGEKIDVRINSRATEAQLQWAGLGNLVQNTKPSREDLEGFETTYNVACELCKSSDDLTPEDKVAELLPITAQQLYVALKQGKIDEAKSLSSEINIAEISEFSTKKIAQNNILLASGTESNPYFLHKNFHEIPTSTDGDKLFSFQTRALTGNSYVVDLLVRKFDGIARSTEKALSQHPSPTLSPDINTLSVFNIAAHVLDGTGKACLKEVLPLLEKRPKDIGLILTIIQLYFAAGNVSSAISTLEAFLQRLDKSISESDKDIRFNPGLLSILISLYKLQGRRSHIRAELAKAASHWLSRPDGSPPLLRAAASSHLASGNPSDLAFAGEIFSKLYDADPNDRVAIAGCIASYATISPDRVKSIVDKLSPIQDLISGIDVSSLEAAGIPSITNTATTKTITLTTATTPAPGKSSRKRPAADDSSKQETKKKRVRKSRLPKDYDPNKKPDPERWLPLRDRSSYRPKGKKGKQRAAERMQGSVGNEKIEESAASTPVIQPKTQGGGSGGGSKKRRAKGKK
ncbi:hypothetical protein PAAG_08237 [Paracoccidioides lutzii Pb01]|uniref:Signal recognition particle subunit SRP72 n=1 Tax=Paracoccidioides lutzii (strain ATCC MYA-826 / Pb01) TaxID=502779 RepID=C1HBU6_PARBA|nr:hypothetical protein PAAG_08237 [Paracoccidioides lutzii Pb01]EEH38510.1 hypothetical protein PAAG_08237 [Paracoccidioides lutzii Pb01]